MSYEDEWMWWLEEACYRVSRGVSLLSNPSEVSPEGWAQIEQSKNNLESTHEVQIFRDKFITDDFGTAAGVYVARYPWVKNLFEETVAIGDLEGDALMGLLLGYSAENINKFLDKKYGTS